MYGISKKMCWICNTKSKIDVIKIKKDGTIYWTDKCTNFNCLTPIIKIKY